MKFLLACLLLVSCQSGRVADRVRLDSTADVSHAVVALLEALPLSKDLWVGDEDLLQRGFFGLARNEGPAYVVTIDPTLPEVMRVAALLHEYAHLLVWERGLDSVGHQREWGEEYARVIRAWSGTE